MASDQFSLHWDNFHNNMSSGMNSLLENEDLVDVTLAVEGKYLKAHKIVLSVCSPYFKELFKVNPCKHPIVFMKDVSYVALSDLLQFMYQGEVQVSQDSLTAFIKTAEALQIKGLTGDNNGSNDNDGETVEKPSPAIPSPSPQSVVQEYKPPVQKQRKIMQSSPVVQPAPKRQRLTSDSQPTPPPITKTEPISSVLTPSSSSTTDQMVQFKMEPYDQSQTINLADDAADDTFGDDHTLDETTMDDTEDYNMMEGGEEEPQAGTSTEVAGEGQDFIEEFKYSMKRKYYNSGIVVDGFTYHLNTKKKEDCKMRYLVCSEYKRLICKARAILPIDGTTDDLILKRDHNHPPQHTASVRSLFMREIKSLVFNQPSRPLKDIYENMAILYLGCAEHKKSGCRGRATLPLHGNNDQLRLTQPHNHPPDVNAEEKEAFLRGLKKAVRSAPMQNATLKKVYDTLAEVYLVCSNRVSLTCMARAWIPINGNVEQLVAYQQHSHPPDFDKKEREEIRKLTKQFALSLPGSSKEVYKRCHARATIPYDGSIQDIKLNKPHNHPPDFAAEEKIVFMRELKEVMLKNPTVPSRTVYATLSEMYPNAARETPFDTIRHKMNRWKRQKAEISK
ncbi:unnamed protein product [Brassicogethes aeneus]|uniref:BTB domain-containing protein n=1 Tax=Brassicogethes aeneus TaxID=1431903 RepID=A0A9P0B125_BRAAE|nr:unnamed protein product [Brassicogethes aeneus]